MAIDYESYIRSSAWHKMREEFLACMLFEGFCAACGGVPLTYHIHHMTYSRLGSENLEDLVALCERCHDLMHQYHRTHPKKANLWNASHEFIKMNRQQNGLSKYCFIY